MNNWSFTGNLGGDCESRFTQNGDAITSFSVGVKSGFGDKATTTWARCTMFGKRGESVAPYLLKGQLVGISGEMSAREWTDKEGGKRTSIEVRVNDLTLLGRRDETQAPRQEMPVRKPAPASAPPPNLADMDDDVPF